MSKVGNQLKFCNTRSCIQFYFINLGLHPKNIFCYPGGDKQTNTNTHRWILQPIDLICHLSENKNTFKCCLLYLHTEKNPSELFFSSSGVLIILKTLCEHHSQPNLTQFNILYKTSGYLFIWVLYNIFIFIGYDMKILYVCFRVLIVRHWLLQGFRVTQV